MSTKKSKNFYSFLYRKDDTPFPTVEELDAEHLADISLYDYEFPFNATFPSIEFSSTEEIFMHVDNLYESSMNNGAFIDDDTNDLPMIGNLAIATPPRKLQAGDMVVFHSVYEDGPRYIPQLLLPRLTPSQIKQVDQDICGDERFVRFPRNPNKPSSFRFELMKLKHFDPSYVLELEAMLSAHKWYGGEG